MAIANDFLRLCSIVQEKIFYPLYRKEREKYYSFNNLRNPAYYVGHWAVFDHAVVYEAIDGIRGYILFEFKF